MFSFLLHWDPLSCGIYLGRFWSARIIIVWTFISFSLHDSIFLSQLQSKASHLNWLAICDYMEIIQAGPKGRQQEVGPQSRAPLGTLGPDFLLACLTLSFKPFGRSGRVTHATRSLDSVLASHQYFSCCWIVCLPGFFVTEQDEWRILGVKIWRNILDSLWGVCTTDRKH